MKDEHLRVMLCFGEKYVKLAFKETVSGGTFHNRGRVYSCICGNKTIGMAKEDAKRSRL